MKKEKEKIDVIYLGKFSGGEILSGPDKTAARIFTVHSKFFKSTFIQYFFDGNKYGLLKKIFGKESRAAAGGSEILSLGLLRLIPELYKRKPQIIHIITYGRFAVLSLICKFLFKTKIIYSVHGIIAFENSELKKTSRFLKLKDRICEKLFFNQSGTLIFYSENSIDIAEKYFKIDESKAVILSGGIDQAFYNRENSTNKTGHLRLIIHNPNELRKSSLQFLKEALKKLNFPVELFIVGMKDEAFANINPAVTVTFSDQMNTQELADFYRDKDILLSLNKFETFSLTAVEAMAAGLVPVVTEETGMSRYIEEGINGFTVKYGDTESLLQIQSRLNTERNLIEKISHNAREIYEILSWQNVYDTYRNIYYSLTK